MSKERIADQSALVEAPPRFYFVPEKIRRRSSKSSFNKANALIHNKPQMMLTVVQQKLINVLLRHAQSTTPTGDCTWTIANRDLLKHLGLVTRNVAFIGSTVDAMQKIKVQWDSLEERGVAKHYAVVFPYAVTHNGKTTFKIEPVVLQLLDTTNASYTALNMAELTKLTRTCAVPLFEIASRYASLGMSRWFDWQDFRDMTISSENVPELAKTWSNFNKHYLSHAIKNINARTSFTVGIELEKNGREVRRVRLVVKQDKPQKPLDGLMPTPGQADVYLQQLQDLGVPAATAKKLIKEYEKSALEGVIAHTKWRKDATNLPPILHAGRYLVHSLKNNLWEDFLRQRSVLGSTGELFEQGSEMATELASKGRTAKTRAALTQRVKIDRITSIKGMLKEMDDLQRAQLYDRYNAGLSTPSLHIKATKNRTGIMESFLDWYANDLYGEITDKDIVDFISNDR